MGVARLATLVANFSDSAGGGCERGPIHRASSPFCCIQGEFRLAARYTGIALRAAPRSGGILHLPYFSAGFTSLINR